jgi:YD repeat-containing protein
MELPYSQREADITEAIDPLDQKQKFFYNSLSHQLARRIDEAGVVWDKAFDSLGRVVSEKVYGSEAKIQFDQQAFQVDYFYDSHLFPDLATRKIIRKLTPSPPAPRWERDLVTMIKPDLNGLESEIIADPGGVSETTQNIYDVEGHLIRRIYPDGTTVVMSYDPMGHLSTIICHGLNGSKPVKAMDYDAAGRLIRQIDPDGTISLFQYDALDRLTQKTVKKGDESNTTDISYNPVNSVVLERVDKTSYIMHRYDGLQRVVHETRSDGGSWDFFYGTNSGSFLFKNSTFGATEERRSDFSAIINKRDALGRAAKTTLRPYVFLPIAKRSIFREWNPRGYLMQETDSAKGKTTWEYDILGRWIRTTFPTGQSQRIAYTSTSLLYLWSDCIGFRKTWEYDGAARPITPVH